MVSAKTNGASEQVGIIRNKDGTIRKQPGRKSQKNSNTTRARGSVSESSISLMPFAKQNRLLRTGNIDINEEEENVDMEIVAPVGRQVMNDFMNMTQEMFQTMEDRIELILKEGGVL